MLQPLKKIPSVAWLILILMSLSACKKDKKTLPENLGFFSLGEAKDYLLFKPGTWWVYECTLTKELDTMVLTYCKLDTLPEKGEKREYTIETINFTIQSKRDNAIYGGFCITPSPDFLDFYAGWGFECYRQGGFYEKIYASDGSAVQFYYPFDNNHRRLSSSSAETSFVERTNLMTVRSKTYDSIVRFSVTPDYAFPYPNKNIGDGSITNYYWAKNIGMISMKIQGWDLQNNKIYFDWELLESHIIK